ncbi:MAG: FecR family protein, partial [Myxococcaceae bacterium]
MKRWAVVALFGFLFVTVVAVGVLAQGEPAQPDPAAKPCNITPEQVQAAAKLFEQMKPVLRHPRCANCHGGMDVFTKGSGHFGGTAFDEEQVIETKWATCSSVNCHDAAPTLSQDPEQQQWRQGMTTGLKWGALPDQELCVAMKRSRMTSQQFLDHLRIDARVKLGFQGLRGHLSLPLDEEPPPMKHEDFIALAGKWVQALGGDTNWLPIECGCQAPVTPAGPATVNVNVVTTQSCTADPNDPFSYMPNVTVKIGPHTINSGGGQGSTLKLPPGTYQVTATAANAHLGYVTQGVTGKRIDAVDGVATVTLSEATEGLGFRMVTCGPHPAPPPSVMDVPDRLQLTGLKGKVEVQTGGGAWGPAKEGMYLAGHVRVHTGFKAEATLRFKSGSTVLIQPMSYVDVDPVGEKTRIWLRVGEVSSHSSLPAGVPADYEVSTPTAVAGVRGTSFRVLYEDPKNLATFWVDEGTLLVEPVTPRAPPFFLKAGEAVQVGGNQVGNIVPAETIISAAGERSRPPPPEATEGARGEVAVPPPAPPAPPPAAPAPPPAPAPPTPPPAAPTPAPPTPPP